MACRRGTELDGLERMARSHARVLLEEEFGPLQPDDDGDLPVLLEPVVVYVSVIGGGHGVRAWSVPVVELPPRRAALLEICEANSRSVFSRAYLADGTVTVEGCLPLPSAGAQELGFLVREVGRIAGSLATLVPPVHGGVAVHAAAAAETEGES